MNATTTRVPVERVRAGQRVDVEVLAAFDPDAGVLTISTGWRPRLQSWRSVDTYTVELLPITHARAFLLHRAPEAIARDGPGTDPMYGIMLDRDGQHARCTCQGFRTHGRCKHAAATAALIKAGHLGAAGAVEATGDDW